MMVHYGLVQAMKDRLAARGPHDHA